MPHPTEIDLLLDLQFRRSISDKVDDWAAPHHPVTRNPGGAPGGPAWADLANDLTVLNFNSATPDFLESPQADTVDLNFTTSDFSMVTWVYLDSLASDVMIICRGSLSMDGWLFMVKANGRIELRTNRGGMSGVGASAPGEITTHAWNLIGATRDGTTGKIYNMGVDVSYGVPSFCEPLASPRGLHIGINDNEVSDSFDGKMWRPRIWGKCFPDTDMTDIFEMERDLFEV